MFDVITFTEAGGHVTNEDFFAVQQHPMNSEYSICAVADGQGGRAGGGEAARLACRVAIDRAVSQAPRRLLRPTVWSDLRAADVRSAIRPMRDIRR